jgi:hypothetical protein
MTAVTNKNMQVFRFYKQHADDHKSYKVVFDENSAEIAAKFGIETYAGFRRHCAKVNDAIINNSIEWKG